MTCCVSGSDCAGSSVTLDEQLITPVMDQSVQMLDTLAAAYAESGRYDEAIDLQRQSLAGIGMTTDPRVADTLDRLQSYAAGKPWRDPPPNAGTDNPADAP